MWRPTATQSTETCSPFDFALDVQPSHGAGICVRSVFSITVGSSIAVAMSKCLSLARTAPFRFAALNEMYLSKFCRIFGYPFLWLNMCLSRQQPIYRLAKLPADCQQHGGASFLFSAF